MGEHEKILPECMDLYRKSQADMEKIEQTVSGLPQRIDGIDQRITELCIALRDLVKELKASYQPKEVCAEKCRGLESKADASFERIDKLDNRLDSFRVWVYGTALTAAFAVIMALVKLK